MKTIFDRAKLVTGGGLILASAAIFADSTRFSDFTPLTTSAGPTLDESAPILFGNPQFWQRSIADRLTQLAAGKPNAGAWDMNTVNETGPRKGRYLFTVFEQEPSGVQRHDLRTGKTDTIWTAQSASSHRSFDPSFWTPWGTLIVAEESWATAVAGSTSPYGRLFELQNPTQAPAILNPVTAVSSAGAAFVHQNVIPRTSHEGIQFDSDGNMYFIDELNGGCLYKYTSAAKMANVKGGKADYLDRKSVV